VNLGFGLMIESLVAVLLLLTIGYCFVLNRRLRKLKADELALKATISELITATEMAERAIAGLKVTVRDCDQNLGERLRAAERFTAEIATQIAGGEKILQRLGQIAVAARPAPAGEARPATRVEEAADAEAILRAAQAFAARTRGRIVGAAA
jgi:hypothetical protein